MFCLPAWSWTAQSMARWTAHAPCTMFHRIQAWLSRMRWPDTHCTLLPSLSPEGIHPHPHLALAGSPAVCVAAQAQRQACWTPHPHLPGWKEQLGPGHRAAGSAAAPGPSAWPCWELLPRSLYSQASLGPDSAAIQRLAAISRPLSRI